MTPAFDQFTSADALTLIEAHPLAWVIAPNAGIDAASQLPLIAVPGATGGIETLIGHMSRANPLVAALESDPAALILFSGSQAYVSPEHAGRRDWAPTWNYAHLRIAATIEFTPKETDAALDVLIEAMEHHRPRPWAASELGERYTGMQSAIIGFRARVTAVHGRFKLGQDEHPDTLRTILSRHPDGALVAAMRRLALEN